MEEAQLFADRHGITFQMLWDPGFSSWQGFGITRQPAAVLVSRSGTQVQKWQGELTTQDHAEVLRLASVSS